MAAVADGKVVTFHYKLTNDAGDEIESSRGDEPLAYLHGAQNIVPGLETALEGKEPGDSLEVEVEPAQGYGEKTGQMMNIPRDSFPEEMTPQPGMGFPAQISDEDMAMLWVVNVGADQVQVTMDHPLAGETLHFDVEIVDVRDATEDELDHGHPHGPGGHHH